MSILQIRKQSPRQLDNMFIWLGRGRAGGNPGSLAPEPLLWPPPLRALPGQASVPETHCHSVSSRETKLPSPEEARLCQGCRPVRAGLELPWSSRPLPGLSQAQGDLRCLNLAIAQRLHSLGFITEVSVLIRVLLEQERSVHQAFSPRAPRASAAGLSSMLGAPVQPRGHETKSRLKITRLSLAFLLNG